MLKKKKILFIAPVFHDYHILIVEKLTQMGAEVTFYPERDYSIRFKIINNFFNHWLPFKQSKHYRKIVRQTASQEFDYLFVIRGYMITSEFVKQFKEYHPEAKTIMYQWDSDRTNPFSSIVPLFDKVQSFDYEDCSNLNITYLPLFYTEDVAIEASKKHDIKYDFFLMGTYMPERYKALVRFKEALNDSYSLKSFIYIPSSSLKKERLKGVKLDNSLISTRHMSRDEYLETLNQSRVIVDVSNPRQTGLAMRIIEALASRRKILTVNKAILQDPYYNLNNIALFDPEHPEFDQRFVCSEFEGVADVLSIEQWIISVMNLVKVG